jgi:hypothetical protein
MSYAFVVAASANYMSGLRAMFNSLERLNNEHQVILISFRLPAEFLEDLQHYSFKIRVYDQEGDDQVYATAIERFRWAVQIAKYFKAICLLDADMWFTADCTRFFDVAARGMIVTGSNGMIINFNKGYQDQYGCYLGQSEWPYPLVHTTAPIFISKADTDWFQALYDSRRVDHWDDFLYLNILGIKMGKDRKMICMPPYAFTGIHHWHMKPETAVMDKGGLLLSGTEEQVYIVHGKWWDEGWLQDLLPTMQRFWKDEEIGFKGQRRTKHAIETLKRRFDELL